MRHPDEGQIHAWLDEALDPTAAAELESHVAACAACADAVAEARGLIAGASRILLALDDVPSGVIPAASHTVEESTASDLGAFRARQHADMTPPQRRPVPWYARRPVQIAASLMLVAGIGGVVVRSADRPDEKVFIQFETDGAPPARGPAASSAPAPITLPAPIAESANDVATTVVPPAEPVRGTITAPAQGRATQREDVDATGDRRLAKAAAGTARERGAEQRQASVGAAEPLPPAAAPPPSAPLPAAPSAAAFSASATANAPARTVMDSLASPLARNLTDMGAVRRSLTTASGTVAGKVIAADDSPIAMATVSIPSTNIAVQTAADGSFTLPPLAPGRYTVEARRIGYSAARLEGLEIIAGDTAFARLAMRPSVNQLNEVTVTGAAGASAPRLGGACFALNVTPPSGERGMPLVPRRVRFRLAELSTSTDAVGSAAGARVQARAADASRAESSASGEPAAPLSWEPRDANSIEVTWPIAGDVVTLTLQVRGSTVSGLAMGQSHPIRSAGVEGRVVECGTR